MGKGQPTGWPFFVEHKYSMPSRVLPNLGLKAFFIAGEDGWGTDIDQNFLKLSTLVQAGAINMVNSLPTAPTQGDVYILSGVAPSNANRVAIYDGASWKYYTPNKGWTVFNRATDSYQIFDGTAWQVLPLANLVSISGRDVGETSATSLIDRATGDGRYAASIHSHDTVLTFNTRVGNITLTEADVTATGFTGPLTSVAGRTGDVELTTSDLTDFPDNNGDNSRHLFRFDEAGTAIESKPYEQQDIQIITTNVLLNALHSGRYMRMTSTDPMNIVMPLGVFPVGTKITVVQGDVGVVTFVPQTDVEMNVRAGKTLDTAGQYSTVTLVQYDTDKWDLSGDLADV